MEPEHPYIRTEKGDYIKILTPVLFDKLVDAIPRIEHKTLFKVCFYTGMRYIEVQRLHKNPTWYVKDRQVLYLPREAQLKEKRAIPERYVPVASQLVGELPYFFKNPKPPVRESWNQNLKRWAVSAGLVPDGKYWQDAEGYTLKMTRASIESWMVAAGIPLHTICLRQGHDRVTSLNHYQALVSVFTQEELDVIKRRLQGW